jgi:hypothetical protein
MTEANTLYYSNKDGENQRVLRDFLSLFCQQFKLRFTSKSARKFFENNKVPTERELGGLLVQSINSIQDDEDSFVATEVQVERYDRSSLLGRLDFLFCYRNVNFAVEFKVVHANAHRLNTPGVADITQELQPMRAVIDQLEALYIKALPVITGEKVIQLALLIYFYTGHANKDAGQTELMQKHQHLLDLSRDEGLVSIDFHYLHVLAKAWQCHQRAALSKDTEDKLNLYGFSIFAKEVSN